jgi:hypothetical protein
MRDLWPLLSAGCESGGRLDFSLTTLLTRRRVVKKLLSILVLVGMMFLIVTMVSASTPATMSQIFYLDFWGPGDTYTFGIEKARGTGDLTVDTQDCCMVGDRWRVDLMPNQPASPKKQIFAIGDGNIYDFSGEATGHPWVRGNVVVSYDSGVDVFPAGMWVRFEYSKDPGIFIFHSPIAAHKLEAATAAEGANSR